MEGSSIISVTSGKGGVGKTVVSSGLCIILANQGFKVLLVDGDFGLSNAEVVLGVDPEKNLGDYFARGEELSNLSLSTPYGFYLIPSYSGMEEAFEGFPERAKKFLQDLRLLSSGFDLTLLDTGSGITRKVTELNELAEEIILISTPDPASMLDAYAVIKVMVGRGKDSFSVLVNRADRSAAERVFDALNDASEKFLGVSLRFLGWLPEDGSVSRSVRERRPLGFLDGPFGLGLKGIADIIKGGKGRGKRAL